MTYLRYFLLTVNWLIVGLAELLLMTAGLVSQGHDKGRLIPIAFFVIVVPAIGYGVHRLITWFFKKPTQTNG